MEETVIVTFEQGDKKCIATVKFTTEDEETTMNASLEFIPALKMSDESQWYDILAAQFIDTLGNLKSN